MSAGGRRNALEMLARASEAERVRLVRDLPPSHLRTFSEWWERWAHGGQFWPGGDWRIWLIRAGRGFGKTRAGSEWVLEMARTVAGARVALVGATIEDVRRVMVEGPSGLLQAAREDEVLLWRSDARELTLPNGGCAFAYSAETPGKLRGPEHHFAWCDELAKWRNGDATWDNLMMGLRCGERSRAVVTTTPRPTRLMRRVMALPGLVETLGRTRDNPHLPASFVAAMVADYGGLRLGRQELDGELLDDVAGALWTRAMIERCRVAEAPELVRVVVGVDPPAGIGGDACGIVATGLAADGRAYVIEDASVTGASPEGWARAVAACAARHGAACVVAEANQGGAMVRSVLAAADAALPIRLVHATQGKVRRAEPVALRYEGGKVAHAGRFPLLEDELCGLVLGGGYEGPGRSPDRADALVWALTELARGVRRPAARTL